MAHVLHKNAKTTIRVRKEIQESLESAPKLAKKYSLNVKTVLKWKKADDVEDKKSGAKKPKSSLTDLEQQIICEFRRTTKFPLDDVYVALKDKIPNLTRSNLYRCLKRNNLNQLPKDDELDLEDGNKKTKKFKDYGIGFIHIDITEVRVETGKCYMFVAIDRLTKYVYAEIYDNMTSVTSVQLLDNLIKHCPFKINKILTDNGAQFTYELLSTHLRPKNKIHPFDALCQANNIEHRLTRFRHPWTNGQVEVTNRIIKRYTTKQYHYESIDCLKEHLQVFLLYYNVQRKLKSLKYQTPIDIILKEFDLDQSNFHENPHHKLWGLNT